MGRISERFEALRAKGETGLVTYVTAGDPDLERSAGIIRRLDKAGADVIELGVPFSDPLADGPVIQRATERALAAGATLPKVLSMLAATRAEISAPVVIFSYANPILRMGLDRVRPGGPGGRGRRGADPRHAAGGGRGVPDRLRRGWD